MNLPELNADGYLEPGIYLASLPEPGDVDYSIVVDPRHRLATIEPGDRRFFVPFDARIHYGADVSALLNGYFVNRRYLVLFEYPPEQFAEIIFFLCEDSNGRQRGVLEVSCHG